VRRHIEAGELEKYTDIVESFLDEDVTTVDMAAALLKLLMRRELGDAVPGGEKTPAGTGAEPGMVRLFLNVGRKMRVTARDIVGAIAGETGIPGRMIGAIDIRDRVSFVEVPSDYAQEVLSVMNGNQIRGFRLAVEPATPRDRE